MEKKKKKEKKKEEGEEAGRGQARQANGMRKEIWM